MGESGRRVVAGCVPRPSIRFCCRHCWRWSSRTSAEIPNRRCGGQRSRYGTWPPNSRARGIGSAAPTVGRLLKENGFSLQGTAKVLEGDQHPDRDAQFRYISAQVKDHQAAGEPVISVDAKKKEQLGLLPMNGREWQPRAGQCRCRTTASSADPNVETVVPYGIYDMASNTDWVNVGVDHDTAAFAVASIRRWWTGTRPPGLPGRFPSADHRGRGGSHSYRYRLWKAELAAFAAETDLAITVCHFPPGTSKWNKIEHRLFSHITMNWRGRPLTSHEVVVNTIAATTTTTGLKVEAVLDTGSYPTGIAVSRAATRSPADHRALASRLVELHHHPGRHPGRRVPHR